MKNTRVTIVLFCGALALSPGGCGDDSTGDAGSGGAAGGGAVGGDGGSSGAGGSAMASCPTLAESWVIEEHCVAGFESEEIPFTQTECALIVAGAFSGLAGTVDENGEIDLFGALGVMPYDCQGTATASEMTLICTTNCPVRLVAQ